VAFTIAFFSAGLTEKPNRFVNVKLAHRRIDLKNRVRVRSSGTRIMSEAARTAWKTRRQKKRGSRVARHRNQLMLGAKDLLIKKEKRSLRNISSLFYFFTKMSCYH
jgi:hypothetical protein